MATLAEMYRPQTWGELAGLKRLKAKVAFVRERFGTLGGRAWYISGPSGTGKTTTALLIAGELASPECIDEFDVGRLSPAKLADLEATTHLMAWGRGGRAIIINEIDGLPLSEIRQLLVTLERAGNGLAKSVAWIFTTGESPKEFAKRSPKHTMFLSRCTLLSTQEGPGPAFACRLWGVATAEGLPVGSVPEVQALLAECGGNIRAAMGEIETGYFAREAVSA